VLALATTTVTVYRGTTTDVYDDEQDADTVIYSGVVASITEQTRRVTTRENPAPRIVRYAVGRVTAGTDITDQDRLRDERTGAVYVVEAVSSMANPAVAADLRLDLRRTT
jgi:Ni,Fe-hydrogenase III small subunit